jgi:hypothetical protein
LKAVNDYSIIVQEYFQARVADFLEHCAKEVFGIQIYFARFELAKSRGQIHVHPLAILGKKSRITELNELVYNERHDQVKQAKVAEYWMTNVFGLTSIHPGSSDSVLLDTTKVGPPEGTRKKPSAHPAAQKLSEITDYKLDQCNLCKNCQMHGCSGYFIHHQKHQSNTKDNKNHTKTEKRKFPDSTQDDNTNEKKQRKRFCRFGTGYEETAGKVDTPGFESNTSPKMFQMTPVIYQEDFIMIGQNLSSREEPTCEKC